jgi:hypothetical protein
MCQNHPARGAYEKGPHWAGRGGNVKKRVEDMTGLEYQEWRFKQLKCIRNLIKISVTLSIMSFAFALYAVLVLD